MPPGGAVTIIPGLPVSSARAGTANRNVASIRMTICRRIPNPSLSSPLWSPRTAAASRDRFDGGWNGDPDLTIITCSAGVERQERVTVEIGRGGYFCEGMDAHHLLRMFEDGFYY